MPQASDELRAEVAKIIPPQPGHIIVDCGDAQAWLEKKGWKISEDWNFIRPRAKYSPSDEEWDVLQYLVDEWDYGTQLLDP